MKLLFGERLECYALLDTGSEQTLFDSDFVKKNKLLFDIEKKDMMMEMKGLTSTNVPIIEVTTIFRLLRTDIEEKSRALVSNGMIYDLSNISGQLRSAYGEDIDIVAIIGNDFLSRYNAVIDYEKRMMMI